VGVVEHQGDQGRTNGKAGPRSFAMRPAHATGRVDVGDVETEDRAHRVDRVQRQVHQFTER
jgi:hypothetical protein